MSTRVVDRVDDWDSQPFSGGYRRLHELADQEFAGVIRAGGAELYMIKGSVVGIRRGSIEDFESSNGTLYRTPSPALPLLAVMQERGDEVRDKFYTEKTAISDVDSTLSDGGFTGYIELSENVLSGDYYQVYHAGRSMSVGFVGESKRLIDGNEAFETADNEVGIYEVRPVDVDQIEIPEPAEPVEEDSTDSAGTETVPSDSDSRTAETTIQESADPSSQGAQSNQETTQAESTAQSGPADSERQQSNDGTTPETETTQAQSDKQRGERGQESQPERSQQREQSDPGRQEPTDESGTTRPSTGEPASDRTDPGRTGKEYAERTERSSTDTTAPSETGTQRADRAQSRGSDEPGFKPTSGGQSQSTTGSGTARSSGPSSVDESSLALETRAIPSLNPEHTTQTEQTGQRSPEHVTDRTQSSAQQETPTRPTREDTEATAQESETSGESTPEQESTGSSGTETQPSVDSERIEELEGKIDERDEEIDRLETELEEETAEKEGLEDELETVRNERDQLESEVTELREELDRLETELGAATDAERRMTGAEALSGTDIFVRYHSKGDATLEKAHDGSHRRHDVNGNLRLEKHTQFDAETVAVGGQTYAEFLETTLEYQFVEWIVRDLLFEIRDTGHTKALKDLYNVLPAVDRAELSGVVDVVYTEEGQETRSQESFDVVLRNRMGAPLLVANLNDTREATTQSMMGNLITAAERVGQTSDAFSGAFFVTESFFEPGALETASDATKGGLLSRDKRKSFVNLSRKRGYHLCLVEARNENFHLAVPEL